MNTMIKRSAVVLAVAAVGVVFASSNASAGTASGQIDVSATVIANCTIASGTLGFGTYVSNQAAALDNSVAMTIDCGGAQFPAATIQFNAGSTVGCAAGTRCMQGGGAPANKLPYTLWTNAARTTALPIAANAPAGFVTWGGAPAVGSFTVYGRVPGSTVAVADSYNDNVGLTLTF